MPESEVSHVERWTVMIRPGPIERWPDHKEHKNSAVSIRPDLITVVVESEGPGCLVAVRGPVVQRNGMTGRMRETIKYEIPRHQPPDWLLEIIEHELHKHRLYGRAFTDVEPAESPDDHSAG